SRPARARVDRAARGHTSPGSEGARRDHAGGSRRSCCVTDRRGRSRDGETQPVPFAGLRRNAPALIGGLAILLAIWLVPDLTPPSSVPPPVVLVHARVIQLLPTTGDPGEPDA